MFGQQLNEKQLAKVREVAILNMQKILDHYQHGVQSQETVTLVVNTINAINSLRLCR